MRILLKSFIANLVAKNHLSNGWSKDNNTKALKIMFSTSSSSSGGASSQKIDVSGNIKINYVKVGKGAALLLLPGALGELRLKTNECSIVKLLLLGNIQNGIKK